MKNFFNLKKNINFVASKIRFMLIKIHNKEFRPYISAEKIAIEVERLTKEIAEQMKGKFPLFSMGLLCLLLILFERIKGIVRYHL